MLRDAGFISDLTYRRLVAAVPDEEHWAGRGFTLPGPEDPSA